MGRWSDLSTSRWIAKADIQDGINTGALTLIASAPGIGNEQFISRTQMEAWISSTGVGASNQFQVKSGTVFPPPTGHTIYWPGEVNIATTPALACAETTAYTVYSECSTLNDGCKVWNSLGLWTAEPTYMSEWYKTSDGRTFQTNSSGIIYNMQTCPPPSTSFTVRLDYSTGTICGAGTSTVYTSGSWTIGTIVYSDAALTTAVTGYNYVVNVADGIIYEINVSTGEIQFDSGLTC